jgi:catechol 2,3-dioxygenase-like lactoylglutathione lyase family enzyme
MLGQARIAAAIPAADFERAKRYYRDTLGLTPSKETEDGAFYDGADGTWFVVFPSGGAASGTHTQIGFHVPDIQAEVLDLKARGVIFEEYDYPDLKTVDSIATLRTERVAWWKDSEGNMLSLWEIPEE